MVEQRESSEVLPGPDRPGGWSALDLTEGRDLRRAAEAVSWRRHPGLMLRRWWRRGTPPAPTLPVTASQGEMLERLRGLPVGLWSYGWETDQVRHLGPMAQDFWATFGLGGSDRRIDLGDANGVCMAAICTLADRVDALEDRLDAADNDDRDVAGAVGGGERS